MARILNEQLEAALNTICHRNHVSMYFLIHLQDDPKREGEEDRAHSHAACAYNSKIEECPPDLMDELAAEMLDCFERWLQRHDFVHKEEDDGRT